MVFSSNIFIFCFLPSVLIFYYCTRNALWRNFVLLVFSLFFYTWGEGRYVTVMLVSIMVGWGFGLLIDRGNRDRKLMLSLGVSSALGILIWFKYANFLFNNFVILAGKLHISVTTSFPPIHLPIGVSFFTFQIVSYLVDVYRGTVRAQPNIVKMAVYKSFFPQLIAGPIIRYADISGEISQRPTDLTLFCDGLIRFSIGLGKKVIIANNVGELADRIFQMQPGHAGTFLAWLGAFSYSFQIYFDFSGYSDMAIGLGRMFGFHFKENFNQPYLATSITDFWRRWHISLSSWFRDYVYIPLGGNRVSLVRNYYNLIIVFFLCGLWHGASWNFVVWGLFHGIFLVLEKVFSKQMAFSKNVYFQRSITFILVTIGWVFFRQPSLRTAAQWLRHMFTWNDFQGGVGLTFGYYLQKSCIFYVVLSAIFTFVRFPKFERESRSTVLAYACSFLVFVLSLVYLSDSTYNPFIYYRF